MRRLVHQIIVSITLITFVINTSYAYAQPIANIGYTARMNNVINGVIKARLARWGFAANDPRIAATSYGVSTGLSVLAGVAMAGGATISWPALLVAAGLSVVVAGGIKLAVDKDFNWSVDVDGKVLAKGNIAGTRDHSFLENNPIPPLISGQPAWRASYSDWMGKTKGYVYASTQIAASQGSLGSDESGLKGGAVIGCDGHSACTIRLGSQNFIRSSSQIISPYTAQNGIYDEGPPPPPITINTVFPTIDEAIKKIPQAVADAIASTGLIADSVNAAWKSGEAVADYVPWPATDPITPAEVADWIAANPDSAPTVRDWSSPANSNTGSSSIPIGPPPASGGGTAPNPVPTPNPGGNTDPEETTDPEEPPKDEDNPIDWGPDPGIGAPQLESTPTAASILDPIFNLMPDVKSFSVPAHASVCPTAQFDVYGKSYSLDVHCSLFEQNRAVIAACALLAFTLAALFIVLRA